MSKYFVEYGAIQERTANGPVRVIECDTSALPAGKITEDFAKKIVDALNLKEDMYIPSDSDLDILAVHARQMIDNDVYGGGVLEGMIQEFRKLKGQNLT